MPARARRSRPTLLYRPLVQGDLISTSVFDRTRHSLPTDFFADDFFRAFFESPAFGLMEIRLVVNSTVPKGIVRVSEHTEIELAPEFLEPKERELIEVTYDDLGGMKPVVQKVREMIELPLRQPESFARLGIRPPKGVLLYGPPGTGKTMVAKAVATETGANFLTAKGSALLSKWYGESEKKVAEFFHRARQVAPVILFFDELDSLAPVRGGSLGEPQVTERVVNQLLAEMDGMEELKGVVVLGATNRPDMIDPALLRPGRFDEIVYVPIPDYQARVEIFRSHTKNIALDPGVQIEKLAEITERFTGADVAGVCMKAGLYALRENSDARSVTMEHFFRAIKDAIPSVTEEMEREYEKLARKVKQESVRIGFRQGG